MTTTRGPVELALENVHRPMALLLPGGHCSATTDVAWNVFREPGLGLVSVSRPGYGRTRVGPLSPDRFAPVLAEALQRAGVEDVEFAVGVSFGAMQAVEFARAEQPRPRHLVLISGAPSAPPYPDTAVERLAGPVAFGPRFQHLTWAMVRRLIRSDRGLKAMCASLSRLPASQWWDLWTTSERAQARALFSAMDSGSGFAADLRVGSAARTADRVAALRSVTVPTLVLASPHDGGVSYGHALSFAEHIPGARLVDSGATSHLFWLGPGRATISTTLAETLATD